MAMTISNKLIADYKAFLKQKQTQQNYYKVGNEVLYEMCKKYPHHDDIGVIISKTLLIGRSYSAAIERTSKNVNKGDDYYTDIVGPILLKKAKSIKLDTRLDDLNAKSLDYKDCVEEVLRLHKQLLEIYVVISGMEKRSLASKYLHFHCPGKVLIYDSRADKAACKLVQRPDVPRERNSTNSSDYDRTYAIFVSRILAIANELEMVMGERPTPRMIDDFLLYHVFPKYCKMNKTFVVE